MSTLSSLRPPVINPSLLSADFSHLARDIRQVEASGAEILHLDIMDGHFVPNLSFGVPVVEAIRRTTDLILDVHLMLSNPEPYLPVFRKAGSDCLTVHIEVVADPRPMFDLIRRLGAVPGLSLNPPTLVESVLPFVGECDLILVMGVMPGFGGQSFNPIVLEKLRRIREAAGASAWISVDGGVNESTVSDIASAGANMFVAGSSLFGHSDGVYSNNVDSNGVGLDIAGRFNRLRQLAEIPA